MALKLIPVLSLLLLGCNTLGPALSLDSLDLSPAQRTAQFFYESQGGKVEGYLVRPKGRGPFPLIVLLHGHSTIGLGASRIVPVAEMLSRELCYAALAISLPGYGMTEIAELNGIGDLQEITMRAVTDGISKVRGLPWVNSEEAILYGFSRGAVFAAALAGKVAGLRAVILHSGAYDIRRLYEETPSQWLRRSINPNGDSEPKLFSVLPEVSDWTTPALILHGGKDELVPVNQALLLRDRLKLLGKPYRFVFFPEAGHRLPIGEVKGEVSSFLQQHVGPACAISDP